MCVKANLKRRVAAAQAAAVFGQIINRDGKGRVRCVHVPGSDGKKRMVILRRHPAGISTTCNAIVERGQVVGYVPCPGNRFVTVCYSSMAALIVAAKDAGVRLSFCASERDADRLARLGGRVVKIWSRQQRKNYDPLWVVIKKK